MANYYATSRTNYFHVTDEEAYQKIAGRLIAEEGITCFDSMEDDGRILHGFGAYSSIEYLPLPSALEDIKTQIEIDAVFDKAGNKILPEAVDEKDELYNEKGECIYYHGDEPMSIEAFVEELQKILPEDECFVYMESGAEKLRYVVGDVLVATKNEVRYESINSFVEKTVKALLGEKAQTKIHY